jgi:hypothetical protein
MVHYCHDNELLVRGQYGREQYNAAQHVLKIEKNKQFNQKELSDWLANECSSFGFYRNTPKVYRRSKILEKIGVLLQPLVELGLISQTGAQHTGNGTNEFIALQFSTSGLLLALIIDSFDQERRIKNNRKIYEILKSHHSSNKSSKHQFFLALLRVYHHQNNLDDMTEIIRKALGKVAYIPIMDLMDIYEIVKISYFTDLEKANLFLQNWKTALDNLEPSVRDVFLYDIKLDYEARMGDHKDIGNGSLYEKHRFELKGNSEETALQAKCVKCNIVRNLSDKTSSVVTRNFTLPLRIKCPACNNINCLVIPSL